MLCYYRHIPLAYEVANECCAKIVYIHHTPLLPSNIKDFLTYLDRIDAYISVNKESAALLNQYIKRDGLKPVKIAHMPPFFNEDKFLQFKPSGQTQREFFKSTYHIDIENAPVITAIGNLYINKDFKNYPLLLKTVKELVEEKKTPVHLMVAGSGLEQEILFLNNLVAELNLQQYVHFLGFISDTPSLLYHSDVHVLASNQESFGLVHVEAALMKKPSIGATFTGAEDIIIPGKTGLLFRNASQTDLADTIHTLLAKPSLRKNMGQEAYKHVINKFSNEVKFKKLEELIHSLCKS